MDHASCKVEVTFKEDVDLTDIEVSFFAGYNYYLNPYKLSWTAYRSSVEMIDADGRSSMSYDNLAFAPAIDSAVVNTSHYAGPAGHNGVTHLASKIMGSEEFDFEALSSMVSYGPDNSASASWIRLGKPFNTNHPSIGETPSSALRGGEFTFTETPLRSGKQADVEYLTALYEASEIKTKISLPITEAGEFNGFVTSQTGGITRIQKQQPPNNAKGLSGFLIPLPMGTAAYNDAAYQSPNPIPDGDLLEHQVLQLFEGVEETYGEPRITISGVPGGVPLPGMIDSSIEVDSGSIHIGGMTDVYVKSVAPTELSTDTLVLSPSSHETSDEDADVVIQAADGIVNPSIDPTHFFSAELEAALTNLGGPAPASVDNMVLEIVDPPSMELTPLIARISHTVPGGCKIVGSFPESLQNGFEELRFRVLRSATTSLNEPLEVLQQCNELTISSNSFDAEFSVGINFLADPEIVEIYLGIDSGDAVGEYLVASKNLNKLILTKVAPISASGLSYRLYRKQTAQVQLPLVRVKEVALSGDSLGIKIPYARPIDVVGTAFSGLNDDPINEDTIGEAGGTLTNESVTLALQDDKVEERCVFTLAGHDLKELGIIRYDVLNLPSLDDNLKHFYVDEIHQDGNGDYSILVLDRSEPLSGSVQDVPFILGKPSIGDAEVKFLDRTFFEVGPDSIFCYEDLATGKKNYLRPSPAESAMVYQSDLTYPTIDLNGSSPAELVTKEDLFLHGISQGDKVRIVSKVIKTQEFSGDDFEHENINVAGQTLAFKIENSVRAVTFSGPNPLTVDDVVNDINQQLGSFLRAEVSSETRDDNGDGTDETYYRIMINSRNDVEVVQQGSIGVVSTLKFSLTDMDNTPTTGLIGEYTVSSLSYVDAANTSDGQARTKITLTTDVSGAPAANESEKLFIEVLRKGWQRVYPSDMSVDGTGILSATFKLTSFEPNTTSGIVPDNGQLTVDGYKSLGYSLLVDNTNYSYSLGESVSLKVSSIILEESASSFEEAYETAGAGVTVKYEYSPEAASIQDYMLDSSVRVLCNNPLVRHYLPAYPVMEIECTGGSSSSVIESRIANLFSTLYPNLPLEVYAISSLLASEGVVYQKNPQEVGFLVHDAERNIYVSRSMNRASLNKQTHIMEDLSLVSINKVG